MYALRNGNIFLFDCFTDLCIWWTKSFELVTQSWERCRRVGACLTVLSCASTSGIGAIVRYLQSFGLGYKWLRSVHGPRCKVQGRVFLHFVACARTESTGLLSFKYLKTQLLSFLPCGMLFCTTFSLRFVLRYTVINSKSPRLPNSTRHLQDNVHSTSQRRSERVQAVHIS